MGRPENPDQKGLIPRSVDQIFQTSQSLQAQGWKYTMQVRYVTFLSVTWSKFADYYILININAGFNA